MTPLILIVMAIVAANLPWLSERLFLFREVPRGKRVWQRFLEWFVLYLLVGGIAVGLEYKTNGTVHSQDWEFYAVTLCLFLIFALPGFIYRHDLLQHLRHLGGRSER